MGIVYSLGEVDSSSTTLRETLQQAYDPLIAFSLMLFLLIAAPCMATVAVVRQESGRWRWALLQLGGLTFMAFILCTIVFQVGRLLGL